MRSRSRVVLTTERRLGAGPILRRGTEAAYRGIAELPGEPHAASRLARPIACFVHISDLHVTDTESPARFEYVNEYWQDPRFGELLTMQRPQETLNTHAIAAMVRSINGLDAGPLTRLEPQLVVFTGDAVDNTQRNELSNFLALFSGGTVRPDTGAAGYEGVQRTDWPGDIYWKPEGVAEADYFQRGLGFPERGGLLEEAMQPFESEGLRLPWIGCYGNHEQVCQGVGVVTPALARAMVGSSKPVRLPPSIEPDRAVEDFTEHPELFMRGESIEVTPDPERRPISREEFVDAHVRAGGHGFTDRSYYVHDAEHVRFVALDTVCDAGGADGSIDPDQLHWLERRLEEVHSKFRSRDGTLLQTGNRDRLVVVLSHHGYAHLANPRGGKRADELVRLLQRFGNVVLWLNGHTHINKVVRRGDLWEVTTGSIVDWPSQARVVELFETGDGELAIGCTMLDHDGEGLAGLHRELAANVPWRGFDDGSDGGPQDRNAVLLLPKPF
ncbi:MAG TPA: metallophosphoesterase [Candidatus Dormibacteraeota bacterium]